MRQRKAKINKIAPFIVKLLAILDVFVILLRILKILELFSGFHAILLSY